MGIWSIYESYFGNLYEWYMPFYTFAPRGSELSHRDILEQTFWDSSWANTPSGLESEKAENAVKVSFAVGVLSWYFTEEMVDELDLENDEHLACLVYPSYILVWPSRMWPSGVFASLGHESGQKQPESPVEGGVST
ncbi:hypothetical protein M501DRAFT_992499 [Patellaria atrata CBS 101060]|uniref:Uncharacterized protein n=1 Tax=Patellaria atrata CBS 101060 TaxID=1346257 RepID=A0A9P4S9M4_9PEZI|nr:hypothetical protein M501DRAFT_992499 [Patellaria atrata CBS 101060]